MPVPYDWLSSTGSFPLKTGCQMVHGSSARGDLQSERRMVEYSEVLAGKANVYAFMMGCSLVRFEP
jgi:hypothetical protein